ncbi:hypothetical protein HQ545_08285 [Candidatus Woesearchaeota archaeon]|nr:hypothetical protein [Candidatus Woesearchaeota archaeon]
MKVILDISIHVKGKGVHTTLRKEHETELYPPSLEIEIEDSAWTEPKTPSSITCKFDHKYYYLAFPKVEFGTKKDCEDEVKMYKLQGWKDLATP